VTIAAMAYVGYQAYFSGIDFSMSEAMRRSAYQVQVADGQPQQVHGFTVATRWQDLPASIQSHLDEHALREEKLLKYVEGNPLFSRPSAGYFVIKLQQGDSERYVSSEFLNPPGAAPRPKELPEFIYIFAIALAAICAFSLVPILLLKKIATPVERLTAWARNLGQDELAKPAPDFHYQELNGLAHIVRASLQSVQESVEREKRFLGYASHELRTPIAVIRSNAELLKKMIDNGLPVARQQEVLARIERASLTMTDLTETLLWLNRHADKKLPSGRFALDRLIEQLRNELAYLLAGKQIDVSICCEPTELDLPEGLCRIVITNLIRNAFQHTQSGSVAIKLAGYQLEIINSNALAEESQHELGFGLGLELTERLIARQGWKYINQETDSGCHVQIDFRPSCASWPSGKFAE
jgi:signal transduction histidine kinase